MAKIHEQLGKRIIEMSLTMTNREIAQKLTEEGTKISHVAIGNYLRETRKERAEATKAIVQEQIAKTVPEDLTMLERLRDEQAKLVFDPALKKSDPDLWLKATRELRATIESRLKYSGADEDTPDNGKVVVVFNEGMGD